MLDLVLQRQSFQKTISGVISNDADGHHPKRSRRSDLIAQFVVRCSRVLIETHKFTVNVDGRAVDRESKRDGNKYLPFEF